MVYLIRRSIYIHILFASILQPHPPTAMRNALPPHILSCNRILSGFFFPAPLYLSPPPSQLIRSITQRSYKGGKEASGAFVGQRWMEDGRNGYFPPRLAVKLPRSCRGGATARSAGSVPLFLRSVLILLSVCGLHVIIFCLKDQTAQ